MEHSRKNEGHSGEGTAQGDLPLDEYDGERIVVDGDIVGLYVAAIGGSMRGAREAFDIWPFSHWADKAKARTDELEEISKGQQLRILELEDKYRRLEDMNNELIDEYNELDSDSHALVDAVRFARSVLLSSGLASEAGELESMLIDVIDDWDA